MHWSIRSIRRVASSRSKGSSAPVRLAAFLLLAAGLGAADATAASRRAERELVREGMSCSTVEPAAADGATHDCLFLPAVVKRRDFSRTNVRASHVVTVLGPDCGFVEILSDEGFTDADGRALHRVRVACTD